MTGLERRTLRLLGIALALTVVACDNTTPIDAGTDSGPGMTDGGGRDGGPPPPPPEAELTITPSLQDFGDVGLGLTSSGVTFTVENVGTGDTNSMSLTLGGSDASSFDTASNTCTGVLGAGDTCTVSVSFTPESLGGASATLTATDGTVTAIATLEGNGTDATLMISPTPHSFGAGTVGVATAPTVFTVTNGGDEPSGTIAIALGGLDATQFEIGADGCTGMTLAPAGTCTVEGIYNPTAAGSHTATLAASASPGSTATASLSGSATTRAALLLLPGSQDFGTVTMGSSSAVTDFTLRNTGGSPTGTINHVFAGANASEFSVTTSTCLGAPLAGGASCTISVRFNAGTPGAKTASLNVDDGAGGLTATATLTATSQGPGLLEITPSSNDFGTSPIGTPTGGTTFTVRNTGGSTSGTLSVAIGGANPGDFGIISDGCGLTTLIAAGTCTVAIRFNPTTSGARSAQLRVVGTPGGSPTAALSGTGVEPARIDVTPTAGDFGSVATGTSSSTIAFTVRNLGGAPTSTPAVSLTGPQSTQFGVVSDGCTAAIPGGGSCVVTVRFSPTTTGAKAAILNVDATTGGSDTADVVGVGITPAALRLAPTTASYGDVAETDSADRSITVYNDGMATITALSWGISGASAGQFTILASSTCGATLAGASNCQLDIRFAPTGQGARTATLTVTGTPGGMVTAALSGNGIPDIELAPLTGTGFDLPDAILGGGSSFRDFTVTNRTTRTLTALTIVSPPASGMVEFIRTSTTCGASLLSGATCNVRVTFTPTGVAGARSVPLTVTGSGGATETQTLTANAVGPLRFTAWQMTTPAGPSSSTFPAAMGNRAVGGVYEVTLTAQNLGSGATGVITTSTGFTGDLNIVDDDCTGVSLPASGSCAIIVRYYPDNTGAASGMVTLSYGVNSATANVTANGIVGANIGVTGSGDFGTVIATQTPTRTFTVTNASPVEATGTLSYFIVSGPRYTIVTGAGAGTCPATGTATLAASDMCTVVVRYSPSQADMTATDYTGTLRVVATNTVNTALTGRVSSQLTLTPATTSFRTGAGTTSAATRFTVTNVGAATTGAIVVDVAAFASEFPITGNTCSTLTAGATCVFDLAFAPTAPVDRTNVEVRASNGAFVANSARQATSNITLADAAANAALTITPAAGTLRSGLFYGFVPRGTNSATYTFLVRNTGDLSTAALTSSILGSFVGSTGCVGGVPPGGTAPDYFDVVSTTCSGPLAGGATCTVSIRTSPPPGAAVCDIDVDWRITDGVATATGRLSMSTIPNNTLFMTPAPQDFGSIVAGTSAGPLAFQVTNSAAVSATITQAPISIGNFAVTTGTCTVGAILAPGGACTFTGTYNPPVGGPYGLEQAYAVVRTDLPYWAISGMTGISLQPAGLTLTPASPPSYGSIGVGSTASQVFTVTNNGGVPTASTPVPALSGPDSGQFAIVGSTCSAPLAAGANCTFSVEFRPTMAGARTATITVTASGGLSDSSPLAGTGVPAALLGISPSASPQTCPDHAAGTDSYSCVTYTISNGGGVPAPLTVGITGDFLVDPASTCIVSPNLAAGGSCTVIVRHTPTAVGADSGVLTVSSPGIASSTSTINSAGVSAFELTSGSPVFPNAIVGGAGEIRQLNFGNLANPTTGVLFWSLSGAQASEFDVYYDTCSGSTRTSGGATCIMRLRFHPGALGVRNATLTVSDGTPEKRAVVNISGTGT